jgi:hypothetical protein
MRWMSRRHRRTGRAIVAIQHSLCACQAGPGVAAARHDLHQSVAAVAGEDPSAHVRECCTRAAANAAVFLPFLLDPASARAPRSPLIATFVRVASKFIRAAGDALVVAPLAASCVQGQFPNPLRREVDALPGVAHYRGDVCLFCLFADSRSVVQSCSRWGRACALWCH